MRYVLTLIATVLLGSSAYAADAGPTLSLDGFGPLKFGMPADQSLAVLHHEMPYNLAASGRCKQLSLPQFEAAGLSFVLEQQKLVRIDIDFNTGKRETSARTDTDIGLGSPEADVRKAYPGAKIKSNPADPAWHTITVETPDHSRGLVFETNGETVKTIRGGLREAITSEEGCN